MGRKLTFWALLIVAVLALSQFLAAWRVWQAAPTLAHVAALLVLGVGLLAVMGWLGLLLYEVDRAAGRIRHQVGVYEWLIAMRKQEAALRPEVLGPAGMFGSRRGPRTRDAQTGQEAPRQTGGAGS